ncbi:toxin C-terminal domain-containing protein [Neisseria weixii]|uniref:toxin C-terminal domain-containing protein n=1 Tax=Neisseria weixii TaxID=1853276 RepID=UPI000BB9B813|nr:toxin C-terminal domain-containing protein [Neisseria weixii]ATD64599.1 hypothetical protein CGZ65_03430 [Neisseria weixii]
MKTKQLLHPLLVALSLAGTVFLPLGSVYAAPYFSTTAAATKAAERIGYRKTGQVSSGQAVYEATKAAKVKGLPYITPDVDSHKGGAWKATKTVAALGSKQTRLGTYNEDLTVRIGD